MAEVLLRQRLEQAGVAARVASAGLLGAGNPAHEHGVGVLRDRGLDMTANRSRTMSGEVLSGADLIVAMAREHVREAVVLAPAVWGRTFTLKELVRRGEAVGPRRPDEPLDAWLARTHQGRRVADLSGSSDTDDVADPIGLPRPSYERLADELEGLLDRLVRLAFVPARATQEHR